MRKFLKKHSAVIHASSLGQFPVSFLKRCYLFVNEQWQHVNRDLALLDQGFEIELRRFCISEMGQSWSASQPREMRLGGDHETSSGVLHEIDLVITSRDDDYVPKVTAILELKNRPSNLPDKNDIIIFYAKLLDYITNNPSLLHMEFMPVFLSATALEDSALRACLGLGIHPIAPSLRPLPVLIDSGSRLYGHLQKLSDPEASFDEDFEEFAARLNRASLALEAVTFGNRFGFLSENTILVKAIDGRSAADLSTELRILNAMWLKLLHSAKRDNSQ